MKYFVPNSGGIGDSVMRSAIVLDILDAYDDIEIYSTHKWLYKGTKVKFVKTPRGAISLGCKTLKMRYYPTIRKRPLQSKRSLYDIIRKKTEHFIGRKIPKKRETGCITNFSKNRPENIPHGDYWVVFPQSKILEKSWGKENYQVVIDSLDINFVSLGRRANEQSYLSGVCDLRGKTTLSEMFSIIYHAKGILCSVGLAIHLGGCISSKFKNRPTVCIFGGREVPDRFPYKNMESFCSVGQMDCCRNIDCYAVSRRCFNTSQIGNEIKDCFNLIKPVDVIRKIGELNG